jgi:hypothetical protein
MNKPCVIESKSKRLYFFRRKPNRPFLLSFFLLSWALPVDFDLCRAELEESTTEILPILPKSFMTGASAAWSSSKFRLTFADRLVDE